MTFELHRPACAASIDLPQHGICRSKHKHDSDTRERKRHRHDKDDGKHASKRSRHEANGGADRQSKHDHHHKRSHREQEPEAAAGAAAAAAEALVTDSAAVAMGAKTAGEPDSTAADAALAAPFANGASAGVDADVTLRKRSGDEEELDKREKSEKSREGARGRDRSRERSRSRRDESERRRADPSDRSRDRGRSRDRERDSGRERERRLSEHPSFLLCPVLEITSSWKYAWLPCAGGYKGPAAPWRRVSNTLTLILVGTVQKVCNSWMAYNESCLLQGCRRAREGAAGGAFGGAQAGEGAAGEGTLLQIHCLYVRRGN